MIKTNGYIIDKCTNGVGVALKQMPHAQSVSVGVWVRAGGRYEKARTSGISHFVEHLLFKGTRKRSCEQLKQQIEGVGGSFNGFTAEEITCYTAKVPKQYINRTIAVLADMMCHSNLTALDTEREREVILEEIRMYEDSPGQLIHDYFNELLWPDHPLGMILSGTIETVSRIKRAEIVEYWKRMYQSNDMLISCVGALDPVKTKQVIEKSFRSLRKGPKNKYLKVSKPKNEKQVRIWNKVIEQTHLCLGVHAFPRNHADRFTLELLHVILGANMSSRLFREVREKRALVYEVGTQIKRFDDTGAFLVYAGCDGAKLVETIKTIMKELSRIRKAPVSKAELSRAKDYYSGQLVMGLDDTMDHMMWAGEQALSSQKISEPRFLLEKMKKVNVSDIRRVARKLFQTPRLRLAVIGSLKESEAENLSKLCKIE